jgi:hypothetical protein
VRQALSISDSEQSVIAGLIVCGVNFGRSKVASALLGDSPKTMDCSLPEALIHHENHQALDGLECSFTDGDLSEMLRFFDRHEPISLPGWTVSGMAADAHLAPKSPCESSDSDKSSKMPHQAPFASSATGSPDASTSLAAEAPCTALGVSCGYPQPDCSSYTAPAGAGGMQGTGGAQQEGSEGPAVTVSTGRGKYLRARFQIGTTYAALCTYES